jgi:opacity protein-like surface antigen
MLLTRGFSDSVVSAGIAACLAFAALLAVPATAHAQYVELQGFEVTPFVGGRFGGTFDVETDQHAQTQVSLKDASSYGVAAGFRFDDYSLIEFRWTRSQSELQFAQAPPAGAAPSDVTLNQFHADFTREFVIPEVKGLRGFLTGSVGATHIAAANDGFTRFSFGFSAGLKQFLTSRLAIRAEASWLPIVIDPSVSSFACGTIGAGGCLVVLNGRLTQQFEVSAGPVIRF